jgi:hypothetical protein
MRLPVHLSMGVCTDVQYLVFQDGSHLKTGCNNYYKIKFLCSFVVFIQFQAYTFLMMVIYWSKYVVMTIVF